MEETATLTSRFREVEVLLESPGAIPPGLPASWLNPQAAGSVVRFTDAHFERGQSAQEIASRFTGIREVNTRGMSFRNIFLALARAGRTE